MHRNGSSPHREVQVVRRTSLHTGKQTMSFWNSPAFVNSNYQEPPAYATVNMKKYTSSCRLLVLVGVAITAALGVSRVSASCAMGNSSGVFKHPGMLHTANDLAFMKKQVGSGLEPWKSGFEMLTNNSHSSLKYKPNAQVTVYRGFDGTNKENYGRLYNDAAAAYALALRWKVTGEDTYADNAVAILNAWATTLTGIGGTSDRFLASGIYGYQLANAAEIMRDYKSWAATDFKVFASMMLKVFYSMNHDFLVRHNDAKIDHYWANWDLANMASMISIGILTDRADIYDEAVNYFMHGAGNGAIEHAVWKMYPDGLGQVQESGRDQGHSTLVMSLMGTFVQMAYNQDCDLFAYDDNRVLKGAEYVAKYNLGFDVNYTTYKNSDVTQTVISENGRGIVRPAWELFYNHYVVKKGLGAPYVEAFAKKVRPEGGGGNYGPNSGGYDQLGYGTLMYSLNPSGVDDEISAPSPETTKSPAPSAIADTPAPAGSSTSSSGSDVGDEADADATDPVASTTNKPTPMPSPSTRNCGVKRSV